MGQFWDFILINFFILIGFSNIFSLYFEDRNMSKTSLPHLKLSSTSIAFMMNCRSFVYLLMTGCLTWVFFIFSISYFSLLLSHGVFPVNISYAIIPIENMSVFIEYLFCFNDSIDMYRGVPTLYMSVNFSYLHLTEKPKSPIFHLSPLLRMLAGFRSRWRIPFS